MKTVYNVFLFILCIGASVNAMMLTYGKFDADHNFHRNIQRFRAIPKGDSDEKNLESNSVDWNTTPSPPPHSKVALMARYIVHYSDWGALAFLSVDPKFSGYPTGSIFSVSDGPLNKGSGIPYFYVSMLEPPIQALTKDPRCSLTLTLAEGQYCSQRRIDPEYPLCPQLVLSGKIERIQNGTQEWETAEEALFSRHPSMKTWPPDHNFFFMKLNIEDISILDYFGGPITVDIKDYFNANPNKLKKYKSSPILKEMRFD